YVPEGNIDPPSQHMRYSATVSVPAARGYTEQESGRHAGPADTALAWAVDASLVRPQALQPVDGVSGDPRRASAELGREGVQHIVAASVAANRARTAGAPTNIE
ncbi:MAG TPA: hypothetical protein VLJ62_33660, partial [Burkholderiaceae bacterium]|nr:hypothetical protein [Burkholderiaceae bacterium]